jgi:hypothetical protein
MFQIIGHPASRYVELISSRRPLAYSRATAAGISWFANREISCQRGTRAGLPPPRQKTRAESPVSAPTGYSQEVCFRQRAAMAFLRQDCGLPVPGSKCFRGHLVDLGVREITGVRNTGYLRECRLGLRPRFQACGKRTHREGQQCGHEQPQATRVPPGRRTMLKFGNQYTSPNGVRSVHLARDCPATQIRGGECGEPAHRSLCGNGRSSSLESHISDTALSSVRARKPMGYAPRQSVAACSRP